MIDESKKRALISHIKALQRVGPEEILLSPGEYFDGYTDQHCTICANNRNSVSTEAFRARLCEIAARTDVSGVFIRFYDYEDALQGAKCWINSDSVYLVTSAPIESVRKWFSDFEVSDVWVEPDPGKFRGLGSIAKDERLVAVWWD